MELNFATGTLNPAVVFIETGRVQQILVINGAYDMATLIHADMSGNRLSIAHGLHALLVVRIRATIRLRNMGAGTPLFLSATVGVVSSKTS